MRSKPGLALTLAVGLALAMAPLTSAVPPPSFTTEARLGFPGGDDWEPAIAAGANGHLYAMWTHYVDYNGGGAGDIDPSCPTCGSPHMDLQVSSDYGANWTAPSAKWPTTTRQDDPQILVDPADHTTVWASFMQDNHSSQWVSKSSDSGGNWHTVLVEPLSRGTDKDILAVRGQNAYLVYHTQQKAFVSVSHDGGNTWTTHDMFGSTSQVGVSLPSGGVVATNGDVYFAWAGVTQAGQAKGDTNVYITKSTDGGATWSVKVVDTAKAAPSCNCPGWDFWGAQMALGIDASNTLYALWNGNHVKYGPQRTWFSRSADGGATWSSFQDVSAAPAGANHAFPAVVGGATGDVRIAWMDDRNGHDAGGNDPNARWNVYYRSSLNGGTSWSSEVKLSSYVGGYPYKLASPSDGFLQPYGDYFELEIDSAGKTDAFWGEGNSYAGPGNVWFAHQN
jgi:hypothetical protein